MEYKKKIHLKKVVVLNYHNTTKLQKPKKYKIGIKCAFLMGILNIVVVSRNKVFTINSCLELVDYPSLI
jgi:hypothetical protein